MEFLEAENNVLCEKKKKKYCLTSAVEEVKLAGGTRKRSDHTYFFRIVLKAEVAMET